MHLSICCVNHNNAFGLECSEDFRSNKFVSHVRLVARGLAEEPSEVPIGQRNPPTLLLVATAAWCVNE